MFLILSPRAKRPKRRAAVGRRWCAGTDEQPDQPALFRAFADRGASVAEQAAFRQLHKQGYAGSGGKGRYRRLYRQQFDTFEAYCRERWGMVRRNADRLIQAAEVAENLRPIGLIPESESQARPLTRLEPEVQQADRSGFQRPGISLQPPRRRGHSPLFLLFKTPRFTADTGSTFVFWTLLNLMESDCYLIGYKITIVQKQ